MYCSKCGVQNSDGSTHCVNCGHVLMDVPAASGVAQPEPTAMAAPEPKTSGLAVAAFVMGLLCMTCILWPILALPAIICGIIALVKINHSRGQLKGTALAVTGLVIPAVLTFILPLFLAILMPALVKARESAQTIVCISNLRTLAVALTLYADESDAFPPPDQWCDVLIDRADVSPQNFVCPEDPTLEFAYAINESVYTMQPGRSNTQLVVMFESDLGKNAVGGPDAVVLRHCRGGRFGCNIAFADGHTEFVTEDRLPHLQWTAE